jgi:hypothetical protein
MLTFCFILICWSYIYVHSISIIVFHAQCWQLMLFSLHLLTLCCSAVCHLSGESILECYPLSSDVCNVLRRLFITSSGILVPNIKSVAPSVHMIVDCMYHLLIYDTMHLTADVYEALWGPFVMAYPTVVLAICLGSFVFSILVVIRPWKYWWLAVGFCGTSCAPGLAWRYSA